MSTTARSTIGILLTRIVVPLWVLLGAGFKLMEHSPKLLPKNIWSNALDMGIDLHVLLAVLIALELLAVGVMFFLRPLARLMAIFMLAMFCLILIGEIVAGNTSCGCLGASSPSPWVMLGIDAGLLVAVLLCPPRYASAGAPLSMSIKLASLAWIVGGFVVAGLVILPHRYATPPVVVDGGDTGENGTDTTPADGTGTVTLPATNGPGVRPTKGVIVPRPEKWIGERWEAVDFAKYMPVWPEDLNVGRHYLVFYSRSCDHCQGLLETHFYDRPDAATMLIAVPENKSGFDTAGELDMFYADGYAEIEMPVGTEWMISPPLVVAIEDGVVKCAVEGEDPDEPQCLMWH